jgi:hypothetical protein
LLHRYNSVTWRNNLKAFLSKVPQNLLVLQEREAKYGRHAPLDLLNQKSRRGRSITEEK